MSLYTVQRQEVVDILRAGRVYRVEMRFIKEKYQEAAPVFLAAYGWFARQAAKLVPKPQGAEGAVWAFAQKRDAAAGPGGCLLKLWVPKEQAVFFDMQDWSCILNGQPLGGEEVQAAWRQKLAAQGLRDSYRVVASPHYPLLKRELEKSWAGLFRHDAAVKSGEAPPVAHLQAGLWELQPEWVEDWG